MPIPQPSIASLVLEDALFALEDHCKIAPCAEQTQLPSYPIIRRSTWLGVWITASMGSSKF